MGERKHPEADIFANTAGEVFARVQGPTWTYMLYKNVWRYLQNDGRDASDYLQNTESNEYVFSVPLTLEDTAVRLWNKLPSYVLSVRFPRGAPDPRAFTVRNLLSTDPTPATHMDALICSLLYRGDNWGVRPQPACEFTWSLCLRMAATQEDAKRRKHLRPSDFHVYIPGPNHLTGPQVGEIFVKAYDDAMSNMNRPKADGKTILELLAYASIAKGFGTKPLPAEYTNWSVFKPKTLIAPSKSLQYTPELHIDALYLMHAARATDKQRNAAALEYLSKGAFNVVFGIAKDAILRVQITTSAADEEERATSMAIKRALKGTGVIAETIAETVVNTGISKHPATVIARFDGSLEKLTHEFFGPSWDAREDTLVELYARLSAVARCVDTKEANVVARKSGNRVSMALIDTEGDWCTVEQSHETHIGPVGLAELEAALQKNPQRATTPLLFASLSLLVFHAAESKRRSNKNITHYPRTRRVLVAHFDTIVGMAKNLNGSASYDLGGTLFFYASVLRNDFSAVKKLLSLARTDPETEQTYDHAQAYWVGGRLIDDLPQKAPHSSYSPIAREITALVYSKYPGVQKRRLHAHVALAEARYSATRELVRTIHNPEEVASACSVDLLTAQAFLAVARRAQSLYTEIPEPHRADGPVAHDGPGAQAENAGTPAPKERLSCAASIAALFSY
jgi:hypothetical protein